jgi:hypothetical protein
VLKRKQGSRLSPRPALCLQAYFFLLKMHITPWGEKHFPQPTQREGARSPLCQRAASSGSRRKGRAIDRNDIFVSFKIRSIASGSRLFPTRIIGARTSSASLAA